MARQATKTAKPKRRQAGVSLSLNVHREWFDKIASGEKRVEYRSNTPFWQTRLVDRTYKEVHFRNGYSPTAPFMRVEYLGVRKERSGRDSYFAIRLGRVLQTKHYKNK